MNQEIRNKLRNVVTQCRKLLEDSVSQELEGKYGIFAKKDKKDQVTADPNAKMTHLTEEEQAARKDILDHFGHIQARGFKPYDSLDQLIREVAFTHLNRLCAYKMMEAREVYVGGQKFREAVSRGVNSNGVKFYLADHEEEERLFNTGQQDVAYRHYLDWLGGQLSSEIGVLFNPNDPANRLYPRQKTLDEVLELLNDGGINAAETELREQWPLIWSQDETIGWVYQYFTPKELRDNVPKGSQAPRSPYEMSFRNQFFTPRYVVEFLTDNTLGRIWYEMRRGNTKLKDQCRYLVRRPTEVFLKEGEQLPKGDSKGRDDLSQEELLKLRVEIPHRPKKDPRELKILDPACGSGHFLLYCFDLLLTIYEEAYADPDLGPALKKDYPTLDALKRDVPRLILANNLHGIDIDLRASQIAALALWLRCQRDFQDKGLKKDRPKIIRSNFVCAEPMPGEEQMLKEFVGQLEPKVLGQVVEVVFDKMKLAGEAGSLLKIEEELRDAIAAAKKQYVRETTQVMDRRGQPLLFTQAAMDRLAGKPDQPSLFDLSDITDEQFFEQAELRVIEALRQYAKMAQNGHQLQRQLFTEDAVRGFAFIDLCHRRYDVVLMNPPFSVATDVTTVYCKTHFSKAFYNLASAFFARFLNAALSHAMLGSVLPRQMLASSRLEYLRSALLANGRFIADLNGSVFEQQGIEAIAVCCQKNKIDKDVVFFDVSTDSNKDLALAKACDLSLNNDKVYLHSDQFFQRFSKTSLAPFRCPEDLIARIWEFPCLDPKHGETAQGQMTGEDSRYLRLFWEIDLADADRWYFFAKGGNYSRYCGIINLVVDWSDSAVAKYKTMTTRSVLISRRSSEFVGRAGLTWSRVSDLGFSVRWLPPQSRFSEKGPVFFPKGNVWFYQAVLNSEIIDTLLRLQDPGVMYEVGNVSSIPVPSLDSPLFNELCEKAKAIYAQKWHLLASDETSPEFTHPLQFAALIPRKTLKDCYEHLLVIAKYLSLTQQSIDTDVQLLYDISASDAAKLRSCMPLVPDEGLVTLHQLWPQERKSLAGRLVSWWIGIAMGRWCRQKAESLSSQAIEFESDRPFYRTTPAIVSLSVVADREDTLLGDGILADDADHPRDILRSVQQIIEVVWNGTAEKIEKEVCELLGVSSLREYIRRPINGGFWDDHHSLYSNSRRNAPIYWLLQSSKKNYAIWLYYHRLDKDLLFKALVNYVEPKIRLETGRLESLRSQKAAAGESGKEAKRLAKDVEKQEDFLSELKTFEDKLRRAANLYLEPDLNDGVVLNIAPLWELVPWREAKRYWDELLEGQYEWSSIGKQLRQKGLVK